MLRRVFLVVQDCVLGGDCETMERRCLPASTLGYSCVSLHDKVWNTLHATCLDPAGPGLQSMECYSQCVRAWITDDGAAKNIADFGRACLTFYLWIRARPCMFDRNSSCIRTRCELVAGITYGAVRCRGNLRACTAWV